MNGKLVQPTVQNAMSEGGTSFTWVLLAPRGLTQASRSIGRCHHCGGLARHHDLYRYHAAGRGECHGGLTMHDLQGAIPALLQVSPASAQQCFEDVLSLFKTMTPRTFRNRVPEGSALQDIVADVYAGHMQELDSPISRAHGPIGTVQDRCVSA